MEPSFIPAPGRTWLYGKKLITSDEGEASTSRAPSVAGMGLSALMWLFQATLTMIYGGHHFT